MAQLRRAAPRSGRPHQAAALGLLTVLLALTGLLTVLGTFAPPSQSAPAPRAAAASDGGGTHADDPCATVLCGTPARVCRDTPGERHAPPPGSTPLPSCPAPPRPEPGAPLRPAPETAPPEHTTRHTGRAPPPPAGT
ncbi:hypothetical protein [Streptomyces sp. Wb2n-11]|uniref:hypothetical protein n=1 Tax=Streptomyces sp. Wb2n-11 TaxID=1030533 RepID=UPI000AFD4197|nr:hypothetical protein [Streptomyces sp. Wb2n-11]